MPFPCGELPTSAGTVCFPGSIAFDLDVEESAGDMSRLDVHEIKHQAALCRRFMAYVSILA